MFARIRRTPSLLSAILFGTLLLAGSLARNASAQNVIFGSPTPSPNVAMGTSPSLAVFNGKVYAAFRSNDTRNILYVTSSGDGINFPGAAGYPGIQMGSAPALAVFNNRLYVAFQANDASHKLFLTSSSDGVNFPPATGYGNILVGGTPALTAFNGQLYLAYQSNDASHNLWIARSSDGSNFSQYLDGSDTTGGAPALAVFNNRLYLAFQANDTRNILYVSSSADGGSFPAATAYPNIQMGSAPRMAAAGGALYITFRANDSSNLLFATASASGSNFPAAQSSPGISLGGVPSPVAFGAGLTVGFQSNDPRNILYTVNNGGGSGGGGNFNYTIVPGSITTDLVNNTHGTWSDSQVFIEILANNPSNNALSWIDSSGGIHAAQVSDNTAPNAVRGPDGKTYPNYAFTLAQTHSLVLPKLIAGRIYVSLGSPMNMSVVSTPNGPGYAGPNPQNSSDPNNNIHYDWYEFTYNNVGIFINTTQVNQFGLPLLLDVYGDNRTFHKQTGITESIAQIDSEFKAQTPSIFQVTPITNLRIFSPQNSANFQAGAANGNYFDGYIGAIWNQYAGSPLTIQVGARQFTGTTQGSQFVFNENNLNNGAYVGGTYRVNRPNTQEILGCFGSFANGNSTELAIEAQFCAAFNRHVMDNYSNWTVPGAYYGQAPANFYSQFWHRHSVNGFAYGFPYDDVDNQSSVIQDGSPEHMALTVGW